MNPAGVRRPPDGRLPRLEKRTAASRASPARGTETAPVPPPPRSGKTGPGGPAPRSLPIPKPSPGAAVWKAALTYCVLLAGPKMYSQRGGGFPVRSPSAPPPLEGPVVGPVGVSSRRAGRPPEHRHIAGTAYDSQPSCRKTGSPNGMGRHTAGWPRRTRPKWRRSPRHRQTADEPAWRAGGLASSGGGRPAPSTRTRWP